LRILITGGNGFIGSHFDERMKKLGHEVTLLDIKFDNNTKSFECPKILGDVRDVETFQHIQTKPDIIFHTAAVSRVEWGEAEPERCFNVNILGLLNTIQWALKMNPKPHIIFASSREVYGEPYDLPVTEEHPKQPISVYGISKLTAEQLLTHYARTDRLKYTIVRFSNVYGSPRDLPERVIPRFMKQALKGQPLTVYGGEQVLDFTFIDDVIDGLTSLIERIDRPNHSVINNDINFATCRGYSIKQLAHLVKSVLNPHSEIRITQERSFDVKRFIGDYSKAKRLLDYTPRVNLDEGLRKYAKRILKKTKYRF
jgi:nucleoside-diphosphate-sugar epimerase